MKKKLLLFFLSEFLGSLDFARGLFVLFLASRGLSMSAVGVLQTLLFWSHIVFEVPAGFLADRYLRKYSMAAGLFLIAGAAALMPFANRFELFAIVFILHGMGFAFRSGADTALLFDELQAAGSPWSERFVELSSRARSLVNLGLVLAMGVGGFIQDGFGWNVVYWMFSGSMAIAALLTLLIDEKPHFSKTESEVQISVVTHLRTFAGSPVGRSLLFFIFGMGFIEATHAPFFIYIQSYFKEAGLAESQVSVVIALSLAATSLGYLFVEKLGAVPFPRLVKGSALLVAAMIATFLFHPNLVSAIVLFALIDMVPALLFVHSDNFINEQIPSSIRASFLSLHSLVGSIFISFAFLGGGQLLDHWSSGLVLGSMFVLPTIGFLFLSLYFRDVATARLEEVT